MCETVQPRFVFPDSLPNGQVRVIRFKERQGMATILIVDDFSDSRAVLAALLRDEGYRLLEAANGSEGLVTARAEHPDLVITDGLMPVMDGYQFLRQLRLDPATRTIPVVFYTAHYSGHEARALALSSGVSYVLTKPTRSAEVLKIVSRVLSGESETGVPSEDSLLSTEFDRDHLRLLTDKLSENAERLEAANGRLRALVDIGLGMASERDSDRLLQNVCGSAQALCGATYVTAGIVDRNDLTVQRFATCGTDSTSWIKPGDTVPGILGTVISERRTLRGDNPGGDPVSLQLPVRHPEVQAFLATPIASPTQVHGWFCLVGNEGRTFDESDEYLIHALAAQVGRIHELEHEILERKEAESALRRERDRAQRYLDTAEVILLALDLDGRVTLINRKGCDLLGWTDPEMLGCDWIEKCVPARMRDALRQMFGLAVRGDLPIVDAPVLCASGEERLIEWRNRVVRDEEGRVIGTFSSGTDITERNRAVEALRTAEERMRFALQSADVGIWDMDYTTGVLQWSEILEAQYGLEPGTFGGTFEAFLARVHSDDRDSVLETVANAVTGGTDFSTQNRAKWPDGTVRSLSGSGRIHRGEHGEPVRGVGISLDVTARRALEEQHQQGQKMEAIGRLAGGVAHDFNNLLTVILGYCELLLAGLDPGDPRQADIAEVQKAGDRAAELTRQLLAFSRKQIIEPVLLDLNVVVAGMRTMIGRLIGDDVSVVLALAPGLAHVKADRGQVEQIVLNLAVNARDAMPEGGTLTIDTAGVELDEHYMKMHPSVKPGPYLVLTVTDTGTGMTPDVRARLFEPFFTTKEIGKGTGLGLATVDGIVTRSGGSIDVVSEVGSGTSFKVYFPAADAAERVVEVPAPVSRPRTGTRTVLVVDDAEGIRELARRLLERKGYTVLVAANANEALRLCEGPASIDVLLADVVMPGSSGPDVARCVVERRPALKVIYMSGYTEDAIVHHGVLDPGIAFLHKPFTSDTLGRKIREVLDL
jgi:two-component system cell cycle sensor histidine kinase/response regulator CckA